MEIKCPECNFSRLIDAEKIPARSQLATCPKCKTKFQFRELPEDEFDFATPEEPQQRTTPQAKAPNNLSQERQHEESPSRSPLSKEDPAVSNNAPDSQEELWNKLDSMQPPAVNEDNHVSSHSHPHSSPSDQMQEPIPGWTGQFTEDFPDPMQEDVSDEDAHSLHVPPPFEQLDRYGFFQGLFLTIKLILQSPTLFFSTMPIGGGWAMPLTYTILITMVQSFVQYFWGLLGLSATNPTNELNGTAGVLAPMIMLLLIPAFITIGQFCMTAIYHGILMLMKADKQGFEGTFRVLAYSNTPIILGLFPMPMNAIEYTWMILAAIWGLIITLIGLKQIHKTTYAVVVPVCIIPILLGMIAMVIAMKSGALII